MDPSTPATPPAPKAQLIDFSTSSLPQYAPFFAMTIDNAFTPAECEQLVSLAESGGRPWEAAMVNVGFGQQKVIPGVRDCGRIIWDDETAAGWIYDRVRGFVEEMGAGVVGTVERGEPWGDIKWPAISSYGMGKGRWKMKRLNERLRFLKYGPSQYFREHCDGQYRLPDDSERSFLTLQLYLTSSPDLRGGATRFWGPNMKSFMDVEPAQGRVLIFQHQHLLHSGEEITRGEKITVRTDFMFERAEVSTP